MFDSDDLMALEKIICKVAESDDVNLFKAEHNNIVTAMVKLWREHTHSAMEVLEGMASRQSKLVLN